MSARLTREFERDPLAAPVAADVHAFVALAVKVTAHPADVTPEDVRAALAAARSPRQYFDAVGVMVAFNFITRVVSALGVEPEIPGWMRRVEALRQIGLRTVGLFFRLFVDLTPKRVRSLEPAEHVAGFRRLFADLRLGPVPVWIERLGFAPPLLAALHEFFEALVRRDATGAIGLDTNQFMAVGRIVLQSVPNADTLRTLAHAWQPTGRSEASAERTALVARFAGDMALHPYKLTRERVDELRSAGLDDAEVLDLAATAALWCAAARLEVLTGCLPDMTPGASESRFIV